ncbi:Hypothetical predicted protein [Octopus vulgaris]|uniref:Uncharacterized protein n=1 Tax=Octopus vulgaris TaxID=6645 RepID=A0AA36BKN5_OCTVU|nr:Hypothetical predicted protein [Octopus vulgaris]
MKRRKMKSSCEVLDNTFHGTECDLLLEEHIENVDPIDGNSSNGAYNMNASNVDKCLGFDETSLPSSGDEDSLDLADDKPVIVYVNRAARGDISITITTTAKITDI